MEHYYTVRINLHLYCKTVSIAVSKRRTTASNSVYSQLDQQSASFHADRML